MAKKGTYNSAFFGALQARVHGTPIKFGFLIGSEATGTDGQRDVVFAAPTPPQPGDDGQPAAPVKDLGALLKSRAFIAWAGQHADALRRLLPGGLEPCGCFLVGPGEAAAKDLAPALVPLLKALAKPSTAANASAAAVEPLVLSIDSSGGKLSFWQHIGGVKPSLRPAQLKPDFHKDALLFWSQTLVDVLVPHGPGADDTDGASRKDGSEERALLDIPSVEAGVAAMFGGCAIAVSTSDGAVHSRMLDRDSETLISAVAPKGCPELRASFLHNGSSLVVMPNPEGRPCFRLRCLVVATVLVMRRDIEARHAAEMLQRAVVSSAVARVQLALEEAEGAPSRLQIPWRAMCRPQDVDLPIWCGDYCMPDEEIGFARERLAQLLGVSEDSFESAPSHLDELALVRRDYKGTYDPHSAHGEARAGRDSSAPSSKTLLPMALCGAAVVVLAAVVALPLLS